MIKTLWNKSSQYMKWYLSLSGSRFQGAQRDCIKHMYVMQYLVTATEDADNAWSSKRMKELEMFMDAYSNKGGQFPQN